ncbi:concanavalin A-like lectin/glucanase [Trichoderma longibrachiatum ATCC 18648]|uniref:Concanavalin A-like lectin/glucanase n=1 Tax=Trichoderma longibrachiatum ATCC 18648 TaxID=983965 RepID=A0A2T4C121_TRILO|nr:concanavalin A-like lectin/glucanase [Trichoderma longibrachiatum ATCC 18648]
MDQSHAHQGLSHHNRSQEQPHHLQDSYSSSWSGAVIHSPPEGETFNSVSASFVIPKPSIPAGSPNEKFYTVAAWVGIDGASASNVILQTGVDMTIAGDVVKATVSATSSTSGFAIIENVSTGKLVSKYLTSTSALAQRNAEWIVENYMIGPRTSMHFTPLANWSSIVFTDTKASTHKSWLDASNATIMNMAQNKTVMNMAQNKTVITKVTIDSSSVTDTYIYPGRASDSTSD